MPAWAIRQALLESASQWAAPDTSRGFGIPNLWQAHLALGGKANREADGLLIYPNPITTSHKGLRVVFEENGLLTATGSPLTWNITDVLGRHIGQGAVERDKVPLTTLTLPVDMLEAGTYILTLYGVPGEGQRQPPTSWARFVVESR
jgi:hypothetical protein